VFVLAGASEEDLRVRLFGPGAVVHVAFKVVVAQGTAAR
jgi:hypothetical protein